MKLHYMGKYNLDPESLPTKDHKPNSTKFKEPEDSTKLSILASVISLAVLAIFLIPILRINGDAVRKFFYLGLIMSAISLFPHELLHAICFKEDVYLYTNWTQGMLFVVGTEDMSKSRFIFMSLLPNIVFGLIPYVIFLINTDLALLGVVGAFCLSCGAGDYLNVFNALTQMPRGSRTYLHGFNSYWFMPEDNK